MTTGPLDIEAPMPATTRPKTDTMTRTHRGVSVEAGSIQPGDLVRDQGTLRTVACVVPAPGLGRFLIIYFEPKPGHAERLLVNSYISVYVWRFVDADDAG